MGLPCEVKALVKKCVLQLVLLPGVVCLLKEHWRSLLQEANWLIDSAQGILQFFVSRGDCFSVLAKELHETLLLGRVHALECLSLYSRLEQQPQGCVRDRLRVGLGSPSMSGCVATRGENIKWSTFTHEQTGILQAIRALDLDLIILPGARLPDNFKAPDDWCLQSFCRKGQNFDSCAIMWRKELQAIVPLANVGGPRRLHLAIPRVNKPPLFISAVYLPPDNASHGDAAWCNELDGLDNDFRHLECEFASDGNKLDVLLLGDMNIQPGLLGAGPDRRVQRERRWNSFVEMHCFTVANPSLRSCPAVPVLLPLRQKTVQIRPGDTHHDAAGGTSRAIDLVVASPSVDVEVTIHNSLNCCKEQECPWPLCVEYTGGDHFLMHADVVDDFLLPEMRQTGGMPLWLHDESRWRAGWLAAGGALQSFNRLLQPVACNSDGMRSCCKLKKKLAQWIGNAATWVQTFIATTVLQGWVVRPWNAPMRTYQCAHAGGAMGPEDPWLRKLAASCARGAAPRALANRCFRFLKPASPSPLPCLVKDGAILTGGVVHTEWCKAFLGQSEWPYPWDASYDAQVKASCQAENPRAWANRGRGAYDAPVLQSEVSVVMDKWSKSLATTPDLIPRTAFLLRNREWDACWPGCLAFKPDLWRRTLVVPKHKQGLVISPDNWRFLEVRSQMGLLQEAVLINRIKPCLLRGIEPGQSGYVRDVSDAQLVLHELTAARRASGLPILTIMGDLARAFPRTWRDDFLTQICLQAGLDGGGRGLLADMLFWDAPVLNLHGLSALVKFEGVPEGVPDEAVVLQLLEALQGRALLPSPDSICRDETLMASCLRAMDRMAASHINLVLHADDPVIVCSSRGAAMAVLDDVARWAFAHKATFHVGPAKTVVLLPEGEMDPRLVLPLIGAAPCPIHTKTRHKWLGLVWPANLDFASALESSIQRGNLLVSDIVSLLDNGGLPLCFALALFDAKVEGSLRFGRWLLATAPGALDKYDAAFNRWACALLHSPPWRSAAIAHMELGWGLCGRHRALLDIAGRRARLWTLPQGDLYGEIFIQSHAVPLSWARRSLTLLEEHDIPDYPDAEGCGSVKSYLVLVRSLLSSAASAVLWSSCSGHLAKVRCCIFCNKKTWAPYIHVLGECRISHHPHLRDACELLCPRERALGLLNAQPHEMLFAPAACVALTIERGSKQFWEQAG
ncbi:unnamed protein product [Symbiodinium sp. CCMP2592]|nr:unnamed protein product [Symbiodinium sp. CCMP2592]